jgi:hypothetical protein
LNRSQFSTLFLNEYGMYSYLFGEDKRINNIEPSQYPMNNGEKDGFIAIPGNQYGNQRPKANTRAIINGLHIAGAAGLHRTGAKKNCQGKKTKYIFKSHFLNLPSI